MTFYNLFKVKQYFIECISHDIIVASTPSYLWGYPTTSIYDLLKSFRLTRESNLGPSDQESFTLPLDQYANFELSVNFSISTLEPMLIRFPPSYYTWY